MTTRSAVVAIASHASSMQAAGIIRALSNDYTLDILHGGGAALEAHFHQEWPDPPWRSIRRLEEAVERAELLRLRYRLRLELAQAQRLYEQLEGDAGPVEAAPPAWRLIAGFAAYIKRRRTAALRQETRLRVKSLKTAYKDVINRVRDLDAMPALREALLELDPLFIIVPTDFTDAWINEVLLAGRAANIPVFAVQSGRGGGNPAIDLVAMPAVLGLLDPPAVANDPPDAAQKHVTLCLARGDGDTDMICPTAVTTACRRILEPLGSKKRLTRSNARRVSISHTYSADRILGEYADLNHPIEVPGYWMHGWMPDFHNAHPLIVAQHKQMQQEAPADRQARIEAERRFVPQWVSRVDQATFLRTCGYEHAEAIGLPFAYLPPVSVARRPGSLLIMPPHGQATHGPGDPLAEAYADYIAARRHHFSDVTLVVTAGDFALREWVEPFESRGIDVLVGADPRQDNTLLALKKLCASAEYVTTNGFGSHIAYAAACGAKVSVAGPYAEWPERGWSRTYEAKMCPELIPIYQKITSEAALRQSYPFLFVEIQEAKVRTEWGWHEIGQPCKKRPDDLVDTFEKWRLRLSRDAVSSIPVSGDA